jgi:hypothetical protein
MDLCHSTEPQEEKNRLPNPFPVATLINAFKLLLFLLRSLKRRTIQQQVNALLHAKTAIAQIGSFFTETSSRIQRQLHSLHDPPQGAPGQDNSYY